LRIPLHYVHINFLRPNKTLTHLLYISHYINSPTRFGARQFHLEGVSYLTVRIFRATTDCKHLSKLCCGENSNI